MKPGGVSTSGLLTLRDAQTMTTDLHAQVGWSPPRLAEIWIGLSARRHAAGCPAAVQEPAGPRSPARASAWRPSPAAAGAVDRVEGRAHVAAAPPACERSSAVGTAVTCGYPHRVRCVSRRVSRGRVSAGQGQLVPRPPEPRAQVRILPGELFRGINSNTLTILNRLGARPVTCGNAQPFPTLRPIRAPKAHTGPERACSAAFGDNGRQAVAVSADRCPSQYPQLHSGNVDTARARLSRAPDRLDVT